MGDLIDAIDCFAARDFEVQRLVASLRPRAGFAERVKLLRQLHACFERAKVDNLSTESFKRWAVRATGLHAKAVQRATGAWAHVDDEVLSAVELRVPAHGQEKFVKSLLKMPRDEQLTRIATYGTQPPPAKPVPTGEVFRPFPGIRLECVDAEQRLKQLITDGEQYDFICTDPPYGIDYVSQRQQRVWADDKAPLWCIDPMRHLLKPGACMAIWSSAEALYEWLPALTQAGLVMAVVPWDKVNPVMKGRECVIIAGEKLLPQPDFTIRHPSLPGSHQLQKEHATPKPPEVMVPLITSYCPNGGVVLDPFMGTAPVAVAAYSLGRCYHGLEIDPRHFATASREVAKEVPLSLAA